MELCEDPCHLKDVCAPTALCTAKMHKPVCSCPSGHEGNPAIKCIRAEPCKNNLTLTNLAPYCVCVKQE